MYCAILCSTTPPSSIPSPSHSKNIDTASPNWCPLPTESFIFNHIHIEICHVTVSLLGLVWNTTELPLMHVRGEGVRRPMTISKGQRELNVNQHQQSICRYIQGLKTTTHAHHTFRSFIITMNIPLVIICPPTSYQTVWHGYVYLIFFIALHHPAWYLTWFQFLWTWLQN